MSKQKIIDTLIQKGYSEKESERISELALKIKEEMQEGICSFKYLKSDGSERNAVGTLCIGYIPLDKIPTDNKKREQREPNPLIVTYFDLDSTDWRSFKIERLIL